VTGLGAHPASSLSARAVAFLEAGPADALTLARDVLGIALAPRVVAERLAVALLGPDPRVRQQEDGRWALVAEVGGSPALDDCAFAVVDVETTGHSVDRGDRITEIAVVLVRGGTVEPVFESLVNPDRPIPAIVTQITRITDAMVSTAPRFADIADQVVQALSGRVFVAHSVRFDWRFVDAELKRARDVALYGPRLCTVRLARRLLTGLPSRNLDTVAGSLGIEIVNRHRAGGDAVATAWILLQLLRRAREEGCVTLADLAQYRRRRRREPGAGSRESDVA
jgi:DNA polymerase III subunit epsilon